MRYKFIIILLAASHFLFGQLTLVSWNLQDFGKTKSQDDIAQMAILLRDVDVVCIQEVVAGDPGGAQAVARLADALSRRGASWDYAISDPTTGASGYASERYAFLWKPSRVKIKRKPQLDKELASICVREPFLAGFTELKSGKEFYVVNFHARTYDQRPEEEITHFDRYKRLFASRRVIIAGDFNTNEESAGFEKLYALGYLPALRNVKTTLKRKCDGNAVYLNHNIDNIYFDTNGITKIHATAIDFVKSCANLEAARKISDHLPVSMTFEIK